MKTLRILVSALATIIALQAVAQRPGRSFSPWLRDLGSPEHVMADPIIRQNPTVPDVVDPVVTVDYATLTATLTYSPPRYRVPIAVDPAQVSGSNVSSLIAAAIDDRDIANVAFTWPAGAGTSYVEHDLGAGNTRKPRGVRYTVLTGGPAFAAPEVWYSTDHEAWTQASLGYSQYVEPAAGIRTYELPWDDIGTPRYLRFQRLAGATDATPFTEFYYYEHGDEYPHFTGVKIFDIRSGARSLYTVISAADSPSPSRPLSLLPIATFTQGSTYSDGVLSVRIALVTFGERGESEGRELFVTSIVNVYGAAITVTNGINNNVAIPAGVAPPVIYLEIGGTLPTAPFTIRGFASTFVGSRVIVRNTTAHSMTIDHNAGTGNYKTLTRTGGAILIAGPGYAEFLVVSDGSYLMLLGGDAAGLK